MITKQANRTTIYSSTISLKKLADSLGFKQQRGPAAGQPSLSGLLQALDIKLGEGYLFRDSLTEFLNHWEVNNE